MFEKKKIEPVPCCRICHEEEEEEEEEDQLQTSIALEAPCACSGTSKFAHRECIQRWCDEKGNTTCEICLQKYEPKYTATLKMAKVMEEVDQMVTISIPRGADREAEAEDVLLDTEFSECSFRSASWCKTVALFLTALLLFKHLFALLSGEAEHYPFSLLTVLALKSCGIVAPMYIVIHLITRVQTMLQMDHHRRIQQLHLVEYSGGNEPEQTLHVTIDLHSL